MSIHRYSAFLNAPALLEPYHQIGQCHMQDTRWRDLISPCREAVGLFFGLSRLGKEWLISYSCAQIIWIWEEYLKQPYKSVQIVFIWWECLITYSSVQIICIWQEYLKEQYKSMQIVFIWWECLITYSRVQIICIWQEYLKQPYKCVQIVFMWWKCLITNSREQNSLNKKKKKSKSRHTKFTVP